MLRNSLILLIIASLAALSLGQKPTDPKNTEDTAKIREKAVEFLRETSLEVGRMRSIENRISFSAELASLMWFHDEKEAKAMYAATISDFKELVLQLDARMNTLGMPSEDDNGPSFLFGGGGRSPVERKLRIAMAVRQQIALGLAEHDAEMAMNFYYDSGNLVSNVEFRKQTEQSDKYFEMQLMKQVAETNAAQALKLGTASLKNGVDFNHIDLLKKIYAKDADKGIDFGAALLSKIKSDKDAIKTAYVFSMLLSFGAENLEASLKPKGGKAIYSRNDLRDIADRFAQFILDDRPDGNPMEAIGFADQIEKFSPGRGTQIRAKFGRSGMPSLPPGMSANAMANVAVPRPGSNSMSANANAAGGSDASKLAAEQKQLAEDTAKLGKQLPKEEREKIIAKARKTIASTPGKDKRITALCLLAAQAAKAGDKELADDIMRDAERLINPAPKNYRDFLYSWMVASGYAEANPDKAFPMLSDTILRANETISAFVKVAEFIDINEEMIDDGEVQVGMFGGSMIRGLTQELGIANTTLISLAKADFAKTCALTNDFDRIEIRVLAKMLILRAILDDKKPKPGDPDTLPTDLDN